ncbi:hypothetical protein BJY59DRAFT_691693 [Rhodotorula toruloides]
MQCEEVYATMRRMERNEEDLRAKEGRGSKVTDVRCREKHGLAGSKVTRLVSRDQRKKGKSFCPSPRPAP